MTAETTTAATDGSALGNPGPGGWAWVTEDGREGYAGARRSTNNRMELRAVLELLLAVNPSGTLIVQTDSAYVVGVFTEWLSGWRARGMRTASNKPVENVDLIEWIDNVLQGRDVIFEKVPGHSTHVLNNRADTLAHGAAQRAKQRLAREASGEGSDMSR